MKSTIHEDINSTTLKFKTVHQTQCKLSPDLHKVEKDFCSRDINNQRLVTKYIKSSYKLIKIYKQSKEKNINWQCRKEEI